MEQKQKKERPKFVKWIVLGVCVVLFIFTAFPKLAFYLPEAAKAQLEFAFGGNGTALSFSWVNLVKLIAIIAFLVILNILIRFILSLIKPKGGKGKSLLSMLKSFTTWAIAIVGIVWGLSAIGVNLSTIFASVGIIALIVGFAAESLIEDIVTGIFLVFEDEFNVGDIIEYNGFRGVVTSIGIRVTCIQDPGGNVKVVNNSDIRNVLNRSKNNSAAICEIPISYAADIEETEKVLTGILETLPEKYPDVFPTVPTYLGVNSFEASSVNLKFVARVDEDNIYKAARLMNRELKIGMDKAGVEIPFQQVVIHSAKGE